MDRVTVLYILLCGTIAFGLPSLSKEPVECTNGDGKYPIPGTCSNEYYFCFNGVSYIQHCPTGSVFDPETLECALPEDASCNKPTTITYSTTTESSTLPTTTERTSTTSEPTTETTPTSVESSTLTSSTTTTEATPSTSTSSTSSTTATTESTTITRTSSTVTSTSTTMIPFNCPQENGFFPIPGGYCGPDYYSCVAGSPYAETCPGAGSIFDPVKLKCVLPENASCIPGGFQCSATDGVYPYPGDCTRYVVCTNEEIASIGRCTPPLVFNPVNHFCDYLSNVTSCQ